MVKVVESLDRILELEESLAEENIRGCGAGLKQDSPVQGLFSLRILLVAQVGVAEAIIQNPVERVELALGLQFADRLGQVGFGQRNFAEKVMGKRDWQDCFVCK